MISIVESSSLVCSRRRERHIFADGHRAKQRAALKRHAYLLANLVHFRIGNRGDVFAFDPDFSRARFFQADQCAQKSAFARTGASEDDQGFAALHVK